MPTGTIARLLIDKGFGFIRDEGGIEHFFHRSSVRGAVFELLREGQRVEFTPEDSGRAPRRGTSASSKLSVSRLQIQIRAGICRFTSRRNLRANGWLCNPQAAASSFERVSQEFIA